MLRIKRRGVGRRVGGVEGGKAILYTPLAAIL
jgi:hypothetical protein